MSIHPQISHAWDVEPSRTVEIQEELRPHLVVEPLEGQPEIIGGVDVSVKGGRARAAVVLLTWPELEPCEAVTAERATPFPYVPGLLAFREGPVVLEALDKLSEAPDVLVFDAHGLAHPRRMGLATHLGILLDLPSVGCAKSCLCGEYSEPDAQRGSWTVLREGEEVIGAVLREGEEVIGAVLRTRDDVKPVFVSVGHRIDLEDAVSLILGCACGYRLPETTRWAHRVAGRRTLDRLSDTEDPCR